MLSPEANEVRRDWVLYSHIALQETDIGSVVCVFDFLYTFLFYINTTDHSAGFVVNWQNYSEWLRRNGSLRQMNEKAATTTKRKKRKGEKGTIGRWKGRKEGTEDRKERKGRKEERKTERKEVRERREGRKEGNWKHPISKPFTQ